MKKAWGKERTAERREPFSGLSEHLQSQAFAACKMLRAKGFVLYLNLETGAVAACDSGFIFEFDRLTLRKAQQFLAWFQMYESIDEALPTVPKGMRAFPIRKWKDMASCAPTRKWARPSIAIQTSGSNVPGHYAELNGNDLAGVWSSAPRVAISR
jgi:hypothetical protein